MSKQSRWQGIAINPRIEDRPWGYDPPQNQTGRETSPVKKNDLEYRLTRPAKSDVMKKSPSLQTRFSMSVIPKHKDCMGKASILCIDWGYDPPQNQTASGKAYNHMQGRCLWKTSARLGRASVTCFRMGTDPT